MISYLLWLNPCCKKDSNNHPVLSTSKEGHCEDMQIPKHQASSQRSPQDWFVLPKHSLNMCAYTEVKHRDAVAPPRLVCKRSYFCAQNGHGIDSAAKLYPATPAPEKQQRNRGEWATAFAWKWKGDASQTEAEIQFHPVKQETLERSSQPSPHRRYQLQFQVDLQAMKKQDQSSDVKHSPANLADN